MSTYRTPASLQPPVLPRRGTLVKVLGFARISTEHQDVKSLDDQEAMYRRFLNEKLGRPYELHMLSGRGSGESLVRDEYLEAKVRVGRGEFDLVIMEDLGRLTRSIHSYLFCDLCEDQKTRLIAVNDSIDTANTDWRLSAIFASMRHQMYNKDTSERIKRTQRNRFDQGGQIKCMIYGYNKPPGSKSESELSVDTAAARIYTEIFARLEDGASFQEVALWLNRQGIPRGPHCKLLEWNGAMVQRVVMNPILKGERFHNRLMSTKLNETGCRKSVPAPTEMLRTRFCPHLVIIEPRRYDRVVAMLRRRNAHFRKKRVRSSEINPEAFTGRSSTWPGKHLTCGICGRHMLWYANGVEHEIACTGVSRYLCWNGYGFDGRTAARRIIAAVLVVIESIPEFDRDLLAAVRREIEASGRSRKAEIDSILAKREENRRSIEKLVDTLQKVGHSEALLVRLRTLEQEKADLELEEDALQSLPQNLPELPPIESLKVRARDVLAGCDLHNPEFGRLMRRLIPQILAYPFQPIDGGRVGMRVQMVVSPLSLQAGPMPDALSRSQQRTVWVDLFDPVQRVEHRQAVVDMTAGRFGTQREIAAHLGITQPVVQKAIKLHRAMQDLDTDDPYRITLKPLAESRRLKRYLHASYRFTPLEGFPRIPKGDMRTE